MTDDPVRVPPGACQRPGCGLPLHVAMVAKRLHLLHVKTEDGLDVRTRTGRGGCRQPVPLHGEP